MGRQKLGNHNQLNRIRCNFPLYFPNKTKKKFLQFFVHLAGVGLSKEERMLMVIGEIIQELIQAHEQQKDVDLNRMKSRISSKYALDSSPRLVDIIAAVPIEAKHFLVPKLRAKPIRSASGVSVVAVMCKPHRCPHIRCVFLGSLREIPLIRSHFTPISCEF